ncbi:hypothetical protein D5I55_12980 [Chakrabartia godavariana]|nr:hypothetical protein D5I55_12980 [Chakrabartia godavariana]
MESLKRTAKAATGEKMTEMQFSQALIIVLLVALFALICWLAVLVNELIRTVRVAGEAMQSKLSANYEIFQTLARELEEVRTAINTRGLPRLKTTVGQTRNCQCSLFQDQATFGRSATTASFAAMPVWPIPTCA